MTDLDDLSTESEDEGAPDPATDAFPLYLRKVFEKPVNNTYYPIGIMDDYPNELLQRISAAALSYAMQLKSIDYTKKKYIKNYDYERGTDHRIDRQIEKFCIDISEFFNDSMKKNQNIHESEPPLGRVIADFTLARFPFSVTEAIAVAHRGALYECIAILRIQLEQFAWAMRIRDEDNFDTITSNKPSHCIPILKSAHAGFGRLYGWLSDHAHWAYGAHLKSLDLTGELVGTRLANSEFKAISLNAISLLVFMSTYAFEKFYQVEFDGKSHQINNFRLRWRELLDLTREHFPESLDLEQFLKMADLSSR